ncbi:hypothetical protein [Enterocloster clostridioformis]|uniref:hypothetical protein n=1 Tax=Enterocloster clostridioformis TaxID=1531 RepID=UPI0018AB0F0E|nr:hypothetical protein [Enterocloster clostridioformis]MDB2130147.1 hypothetical protein [Enterocloster clostridioformis]
MPLPIWLIPLALKVAAVAAGAAGVGSAVHGAKKMKDANDTMEAAKSRHERNMEKFEKEKKTTSKAMDKLGKMELEILHSFSEFSDVFEQIKNRPTFETYSKNGVTLPKYDGGKIKEVSVGAGVLLGGLGGAGLGAAGGFAAAGATTSAVMALGTASTGTAIASLNGAAATNATLALLGGGIVEAGGGGMAAGAAALGAATLGIGLLVGGVIFSFTGAKLSEKADEAWDQMKKAENRINAICNYLVDLRRTSNNYYKTLSKVNTIYHQHLNELNRIVTLLGHKNWKTFTAEEKSLTENTVLLVGLLYNMCMVELVLKSKTENNMNTINKAKITKSINNAKEVLADKFQATE